MEFVSPIFDLYSDYLLVNQGQPTATRLAALVDGKLSHDAITRSLHQQDYNSVDLWQVVKPFVHQIAKPMAYSSSMITWRKSLIWLPIR